MDPAVLTLAFVAGAVAAFNPWGFALLPAYLTLVIGGGAAIPSPAHVLSPMWWWYPPAETNSAPG